MPNPSQITPAHLMRLVGTPECPALIDVRLPEDLALDPRLIPGSFVLSHDQFDPAPPDLAGRRVVIICAKGRKLSEGVAALLRAQTIPAESLEGGSVAWAEAGLPMVPRATVPKTRLWVTRHRPKIDRIACPWLIRRFIDPLAISLGLSVNFPDDYAMLEQGMTVYDALYAWIKPARAEVHNANRFKKT